MVTGPKSPTSYIFLVFAIDPSNVTREESRTTAATFVPSSSVAYILFACGSDATLIWRLSVSILPEPHSPKTNTSPRDPQNMRKASAGGGGISRRFARRFASCDRWLPFFVVVGHFVTSRNTRIFREDNSIPFITTVLPQADGPPLRCVRGTTA